MARFIQKSGLVAKINSQDWQGFARAYNGPGYRKNLYDKKIAAAFARYQKDAGNQQTIGLSHSDMGLPDKKPLLKMRSRGRAVKALQRLLSDQTNKLVVDGKFGRKTRQAVERFQSKTGLTVDGVVGVETWKKLMSVTNNIFIRSQPKLIKPTLFSRFVDFVVKTFGL